MSFIESELNFALHYVDNTSNEQVIVYLKHIKKGALALLFYMVQFFLDLVSYIKIWI